MLLSLLSTLLPTILIELGVLWFVRERRRSVLVASVVANVFTNIPLNLYVSHVDDSLSTVLAGEALVVATEAVVYFVLTRQLSVACAYSLLCNLISFLTGLLFQLLWLVAAGFFPLSITL